MSKIMEVLQIKPDYKNNKAKITLGDTSYSTFGKKFASVPGQTVDNITAGEYLGYETIHDLYTKQKVIFDKLETAKATINAWCSEKSGTYGLGTIHQFAPGLSLADYRGDFSEGSSAGWKALTTFINPENTLYKYTRDAGIYFSELQEYLQEWSKNRNYLSTTSKVIGYFETGWNKYPRAWTSNSYGLTIVNVPSSSDKVYVHVTDLENIPDGVTATIKIEASWEGGSDDDPTTNYEYGYMYIKRDIIDGDSKLTCWATRGDLDDRGEISGYERTGVSATHFSNATPDWSWILSRVLTV